MLCVRKLVPISDGRCVLPNSFKLTLMCFMSVVCVCVCQGGMYVLQLMDTYAASWSVFLMAITECAIIAWIYGTAQWNLTWDVRWWACFFVWFLL